MFHTIQLKKILTAAMVIAVVMVFTNCTKRGDNLKLGATPEPSFDISPGADGNRFVVVNKTPGASIPYWRISNGENYSGDTARLYFIFQGTYDVKLFTVTQGGLDSVTKTITVAQNDPTACNRANAIGFIASCDKKTWKLNPAAGAYKVGPGVGNGGWWTSDAAAVTARACEFNDEYTFSFNATRTFQYDNKGDFFADNNLGPNDGGCHPNSQFKPIQMPWASGTFSYDVLGGGVRGLGQLRVNGLGAHIGLQKVYNMGEAAPGTGPTATSVTYDILEMQRNPGGATYDIMVLGVQINADGWWTFTLRSY